MNVGNFQAQSNAHKTLAYLMRENYAEIRLRQLLNYKKGKVGFENEVLNPLIKYGAIKAYSNSIFIITSMGQDLYLYLQDQSPFFIEGGLPKKAEKKAFWTFSAYDGAELKPYDGRPGAMDFIKLPSLMGSKLIYRKDAV